MTNSQITESALRCSNNFADVFVSRLSLTFLWFDDQKYRCAPGWVTSRCQSLCTRRPFVYCLSTFLPLARLSGPSHSTFLALTNRSPFFWSVDSFFFRFYFCSVFILYYFFFSSCFLMHNNIYSLTVSIYYTIWCQTT